VVLKRSKRRAQPLRSSPNPHSSMRPEARDSFRTYANPYLSPVGRPVLARIAGSGHHQLASGRAPSLPSVRGMPPRV
jgi:hypothetical protein